ncbi:MAG: hypothetical protein KJ558_14235 [Gammaproteobacteria bacterium]|nr:hypothetical protein [Gammaproteobacteria bacterium]MBU1655947.1 hypothetical protein [Gammaproteobacteria bacterium]MBU1962459.1 hypothetical protein [Gammaproteobacteria bacterium]
MTGKSGIGVFLDTRKKGKKEEKRRRFPFSIFLSSSRRKEGNVPFYEQGRYRATAGGGSRFPIAPPHPYSSLKLG